MKATVLKPFNYGPDGVHGEVLKVGEEREFPEALCPGLIAEGFIKPPTKAGKQAPAAPAAIDAADTPPPPPTTAN